MQKRWFPSLATSYKAPTVEDLDGDGNSEVILLEDNDSLYVWTHDGKAYANPSVTHGRFAQTPFGTQNNFQTVAVGQATLDHTGKEIFMSMGNDNRRPRVACYA